MKEIVARVKYTVLNQTFKNKKEQHIDCSFKLLGP